MTIRYINFHPAEFLAGVAGMTPEEIGVYWVICSLIYASDGPIMADDPRLRAMLRCHGNTLNCIIGRLEKSGKLSRNGLEITQKRCANELEKARKRSGNAQENGWKGGRPAKESNDLEKPVGFADEKPTEKLTINHKPITKNQETRASALVGFSVWYGRYPHKVGRAAAERAYRKAISDGATDEMLLAGLDRYVGSKPPDRPWCNPATWLNQQRWLDEPAKTAEAPTARPAGIATPTVTPSDEPWEQRVKRWRTTRFWMSGWGPQPDQPDCRAPAWLIQH